MARAPQRLCVCASHSPLIDSVDAGAAGQRFLDGLADAGRAIREFAPDLVVFFGPDHIRAFPTVVPAFALATEASGYGDWGTSTDRYDIPSGTARALAANLLDGGYDITVAEGIKLDHGFGQTFGQLFGGLDAVPVIPIVINCAQPPLPPVHRAVALGRAVGRFFDGRDDRVVFIGSGGLSHAPPSPVATLGLPEEERRRIAQSKLADAALGIRPDWDERFLGHVERGEWAELEGMTQEEVLAAGSGANEVRTWLAASAAAKTPLSRLAYEPISQWITGMGIVATTEVTV
jgi:2,3-dihydroxyphenylpropionate 1,2-dioxygenase